MIVIIIYLIGVFIAYFLIRKMEKFYWEKYGKTWSDVINWFAISLFSWITILAVIIFHIRDSR